MTPSPPQTPRPHSTQSRDKSTERDAQPSEQPPVDPRTLRYAYASDGTGPWLYAPDGTGPWTVSTHNPDTFTLEQPRRTTWVRRFLGNSWGSMMPWQIVVVVVAAFVGFVIFGTAAGFGVGIILNHCGSW